MVVAAKEFEPDLFIPVSIDHVGCEKPISKSQPLFETDVASNPGLISLSKRIL